MLGVLGLDPLDPQWATAGGRPAAEPARRDRRPGAARPSSSAQAARARKDYAAADAIRDQLGALGVQVEDTPRAHDGS